MAGMEVVFIDRPVGPPRGRFRVSLHGPPKVCHEAILVVYGFNPRLILAIQQHGPGAKERLYVIRNIPEPFPKQSSHQRFTAKPRERGFDWQAHFG